MGMRGSDNRIVDNRVNALNYGPGVDGRAVLTRNVAGTLLIFRGAPDATSPTVTVSHNRSSARTEPGQTQGGIFLLGTSHAIVRDNSIVGVAGTGPPNTGIAVLLNNEVSTGNTIARNFVQGAQTDGILVDAGVTDTLLRGNTTIANGNDGIRNDGPTSTLTANLANDNNNLGIESVPGAIDGGGNRASGNGNPLQCLNVTCR
jgi:hypothetical protein